MQGSIAQDGVDADNELARLLLLDQSQANAWMGNSAALRAHYEALYAQAKLDGTVTLQTPYMTVTNPAGCADIPTDNDVIASAGNVNVFAMAANEARTWEEWLRSRTVVSPNPSSLTVTTACGSMVIDQSLDAFNQLTLDAHNAYRATHHALPLAYAADLAADAAAYANTLEASGQFLHDPALPNDQGETLYRFFHSDPAS